MPRPDGRRRGGSERGNESKRIIIIIIIVYMYIYVYVEKNLVLRVECNCCSCLMAIITEKMPLSVLS